VYIVFVPYHHHLPVLFPPSSRSPCY
jgi:hypothetical protein